MLCASSSSRGICANYFTFRAKGSESHLFSRIILLPGSCNEKKKDSQVITSVLLSLEGEEEEGVMKRKSNKKVKN